VLPVGDVLHSLGCLVQRCSVPALRARCWVSAGWWYAYHRSCDLDAAGFGVRMVGVAAPSLEREMQPVTDARG
jgi:hypothetical protein